MRQIKHNLPQNHPAIYPPKQLMFLKIRYRYEKPSLNNPNNRCYSAIQDKN